MNALNIELNYIEVVVAVVVLILTVALYVVQSNRTMADNNHCSSNNYQIMDTEAVPRSPQHEQQQEEIVNLLQYAKSSYTSNPSDALSALMGALTLSSGSNNAAEHAMQRIRSELGDVVADSISPSSFHNPNRQQNHQCHYSEEQSREMTRRAMEIIEQLLNDKSTFLYGQGRQHLLQQAMEDGSSVVCTKCGDMIKAERIEQHMKYWCRSVVEEENKSCYSSGDDEMERD